MEAEVEEETRDRERSRKLARKDARDRRLLKKSAEEDAEMDDETDRLPRQIQHKTSRSNGIHFVPADEVAAAGAINVDDDRPRPISSSSPGLVSSYTAGSKKVVLKENPNLAKEERVERARQLKARLVSADAVLKPAPAAPINPEAQKKLKEIEAEKKRMELKIKTMQLKNDIKAKEKQKRDSVNSTLDKLATNKPSFIKGASTGSVGEQVSNPKEEDSLQKRASKEQLAERMANLKKILGK